MSKATISPWTMRQSGGVYVIDGHEGRLQNIAEVYTGIEDALVVTASRDLLDALVIAYGLLAKIGVDDADYHVVTNAAAAIGKATGDKS